MAAISDKAKEKVMRKDYRCSVASLISFSGRRKESTASFMQFDEHGQRIVGPTENTYQLGPLKVFPVDKVENILQEIVTKSLQDEKYDPHLCREKTQIICELVLPRVREELMKSDNPGEVIFSRYKLVFQISVGQLNGQSGMFASRCLWDTNHDNFASFSFQNKSLYAVATVFGIYFE